jgi:Transposase domain (DUF772)
VLRARPIRRPRSGSCYCPSRRSGCPPNSPRIDAYLDDERFVAPWRGLFSRRLGRPSVPIDTLLRPLYLKHRYQLGYESLCPEVADSISWQRFCRIGLDGQVPHPTTLVKLVRHAGPEVVEQAQQRPTRVMRDKPYHRCVRPPNRCNARPARASIQHRGDASMLKSTRGCHRGVDTHDGTQTDHGVVWLGRHGQVGAVGRGQRQLPAPASPATCSTGRCSWSKSAGPTGGSSKSESRLAIAAWRSAGQASV